MALPTLRVMADSNLFDSCIEPTRAGEALLRAVATGQLELVITHIQQTEHDDIGDEAKKLAILAIPRTVVGASVFVLDHSRLDVDRMGDGEVYDAVYGGTNPKRVRDAMIADTAADVGIPLVTGDQRLQRRATRAGVTVWSVTDLIDQLSNSRVRTS